MSESKKTRVETFSCLGSGIYPLLSLNPRKQGLKQEFLCVLFDHLPSLNPRKQGLKPKSSCNSIIPIPQSESKKTRVETSSGTP